MFEGSYDDDDDVCQFCNKNNGYLVEFSKGWACLSCVNDYGVEDFIGPNRVEDGRISLKDVNSYYYDEYGEYEWVNIKPIKVPVIIEELACDPKNLASPGLILRQTIIPIKDMKFGKRWQLGDVEIFD
jgi:hypothetical protein